jgi:hypothetical protein
MDAVALLHRAQEVGLRIEPMGEKLLVRGPKRAEPVVKLLAEHKAEVLAALSPSFSDPSWWRERFAAKAVQWLVGDRDWDAAKRLAWGDLENEWHELHGRRWPRGNAQAATGRSAARRWKIFPTAIAFISNQSTVRSTSANAGEATRARHLSHLGSNHPAFTEVSYDRD